MQSLLFAIAILFGVGIGISIVVHVVVKPHLLWPILVIGSIVSTGFMLYGYTMLDEYFLGCILLGGFLANSLATKRYRSRHSNILEYLHRLFFFMLIMYIIFQCFRGILILDSPRKIRWVGFYMMLGALVFILFKKRYPIPTVRKMSFMVLIASLSYFSLYLCYGVLFEFMGINRYQLQYAQSGSWYAIWGTTAYVMFPIVIAMPTVIISIKDRDRVYRRLGWATLLVLISTALYYDSRVAVLAITAFMLVSSISLGLRKWLVLTFISLLVLSFFFSIVWHKNRDIGSYLNDTFGTISSLLKAEESGVGGHDIDRYIWAKAGFLSIGDSWEHFLFGYGFRTSGRVVAPQVYNLFIRYERPKAYNENVSTEAITNLLVDTGIVGLLLLISNFIMVALQIWKWEENPNRFVLILSLFIIFGWLFVINIVDVTLFYLMIMPSGFFVQLSRYGYAQD